MNKSPLRILCAVRTFHRYGGVPRSTYELVTHWAKEKDVVVTVVTAEKKVDIDSTIPLNIVKAPVLRFSGKGILQKVSYALEIFSFSITASIYLWLHRNKYDVLYAPSGQTFAPCVYTVQSCHRAWTLLRMKNGDWLWLLNPIHLWILFIEWYAYQFGRHITAISNVVARDMLNTYPFLKDNPPTIIPHGVNTDEFQPDEEKRKSIRSELAITQDDFLLLFVGYEYERKGLPNIIEVLPKLSEKVHLAVVGEDSLRRGKLETVSKELSVFERVHFLGTQKNVSPYFQAADLFVFPSKMDAFALVVLEAMASGLPVITTNEVGASFCVGDEGVVLDVPISNDHLLNAINRYVNNREYSNEASIKAVKRANHYTWHRIAQQYLELFRKLRL